MTTFIVFLIVWLLAGVVTICLDYLVSYATDEKPPGIGEYVLSLFFGPVALTFFILYTVFELLLDIKLLSKYPVTVSIVMFTIIALVCHIIYVTWLI